MHTLHCFLSCKEKSHQQHHKTFIRHQVSNKLYIEVTSSNDIFDNITFYVYFYLLGSTLCRQGWTLFNGMCYIVGNQTSSEYISWFEAEERCKKLGNGGHLVSIHNKDEGNFLKFLRYATHNVIHRLFAHCHSVSIHAWCLHVFYHVSRS